MFWPAVPFSGYIIARRCKSRRATQPLCVAPIEANPKNYPEWLFWEIRFLEPPLPPPPSFPPLLASFR